MRDPRDPAEDLNLDQDLIERARTALGRATETDTIPRALIVAVELAGFRRELAEGAAALYGRGGFVPADDETSLDFRGFRQKTGRWGATLVTANTADFALIAQVMTFRFRHDLPDP